MPANLPSSFASAAAGQNANKGGRADGRGGSGGDWARRDGRSTNGTLTLRRSSTTPVSHSSQTPAPSEPVTHLPVADVMATAQPPVELSPQRYSRDTLLDIYRNQRPQHDPSRLFMSGWTQDLVNGGAPRPWGKSNDNHVPQEPGACWDENGFTGPMGLLSLTAEEKEAFAGEINSPLKPPTQKQDAANPAGVNGRKASLSHGTTNTFGVSSPTAPRPGARRRETLESNPFSGGLNSPTAASRPSRDDPSWLARKSGDLKDSEADDGDADHQSREPPKLPIGTLLRTNTSNSIWSQTSTPTTPSAGAFGNFAIGGSTIGDKRAGGAGGGSRLAHLMQKDTAEAASSRPSEVQSPINQQSWRSRQRTDTDPFGDDGLSGSAVLGGAQDTAAGQPIGRVGGFGTPVKGSTGDFGMSGLNLGSQDDNGPLSPSETNPYRSPAADRHEHEDDSGAHKSVAGFSHDQSTGFNPLQRGFGPSALEGSDRSQTSSAGAKGFPVGHMSGWPAPGVPSTGTPDRERTNFPGGPFPPTLFNTMSDLQSPTLGNLNNVFGPGGSGSIGRGSKLGSLFPAAMQAQMQAQHDAESLGDGNADLRQANPLGAIGRSFGIPPRDSAESPMRSSRGVFEELFPSSDAGRAQNMFSDPNQPGGAAGVSQSFTPVSGGMSFGGGAQASVEPPSAQARTMVMPDRMRWVYLDPQGQIQGPFTGLEMNDWYKAHFFTPDLRVKKVEDPEFEPLGQLIRRIGNSREPFLVPQVGIPHGPPAQAAAFPPTGGAGGVVPPLSGVFPSFGRTLTAEEQNNLERRKQEEQYLMAQQREFAMRQQAMTRFQGQQPGLQHHSSAQSLQSQPSFGSITSPIGLQGQMPQQPIGAVPPASGPATGFFGAGGETQPPQGAGSGNREPFQEGELGNLTLAERQVLAVIHAGQPGNQAASTLSSNDGGLRGNLPDTEQLGEDPEGFRQRLQEFDLLRAQHEAEQQQQQQQQQQAQAQEEPSAAEANEAGASVEDTTPQVPEVAPAPTRKSGKAKKKYADDLTLSLTQQVQKTQAAVAAVAAAQTQPIEPGMPMPFPPPSSTTPLPAPTAQRVRSQLPEQYSRSQSGSPGDDASAQPPPLAPWAKDPGHDAHKGPSLKEIQEAEARKAAKAEEVAAALRKSALEQEAALIREKEKQAAASASAAGLPATSTWGHGSPVSASSPWSKPGTNKVTTPGPVGGAAASNKKTLAEIQREEENRKLKAKDTAAPASVTTSTSKSYANLAGKPGQPAVSAAALAAAAAAPTSAGWATVGAGGKVKTPAGASSPQVTRSASASNVKVAPAAPVKPYSRPAAGSGRAEANVAMDEFRKWVYRELSRGITGINDINNFQTTLDVLPLDTGIIADAVYANSTTMDGRHFAEEYVRRKKLAEKGVAEKQPPTTAEPKTLGNAAGGWSEVAKKSGAPVPKESTDPSTQAAGFKVVPSRKKGKK